jgi:hypothetical protein
MNRIIGGQSTFPNSVHKQALWKQLFESADELNLDDLDAAGGAAIAEPENRKPWQSSEESGK